MWGQLPSYRFCLAAIRPRRFLGEGDVDLRTTLEPSSTSAGAGDDLRCGVPFLRGRPAGEGDAALEGLRGDSEGPEPRRLRVGVLAGDALRRVGLSPPTVGKCAVILTPAVATTPKTNPIRQHT